MSRKKILLESRPSWSFEVDGTLDRVTDIKEKYRDTYRISLILKELGSTESLYYLFRDEVSDLVELNEGASKYDVFGIVDEIIYTDENGNTGIKLREDIRVYLPKQVNLPSFEYDIDKLIKTLDKANILTDKDYFSHYYSWSDYLDYYFYDMYLSGSAEDELDNISYFVEGHEEYSKNIYIALLKYQRWDGVFDAHTKSPKDLYSTILDVISNSDDFELYLENNKLSFIISDHDGTSNGVIYKVKEDKLDNLEKRLDNYRNNGVVSHDFQNFGNEFVKELYGV